MTFDDGMLTVYRVENTAQPGMMPVENLIKKGEYYYHTEQVGINRYYAAMEADQQIDALVDIPGWEDVKTTDYVKLDSDDHALKVSFVQTALDDNNLKMTRLTLEKVEMNYELPK